MSKKIKDLPIYGGTSLGWLEDAEEVEKEELLLKDLSSRLPYGVKAYAENVDLNGTIGGLSLNSVFLLELHDWWDIEFIKPYLRPMSSMTEEELHEIQEILGKGVEIRDSFILIVDSSINTFSYLELQAMFEWLLKNHFDFMGLIPKALALEAPKGMYN